MRLVHEQPVHAEFLEGQRVVLLVVGGQGFQSGFQPFFGLFKFLYQPAIVTVGVFAFDFLQFLQLLLKESNLGFL